MIKNAEDARRLVAQSGDYKEQQRLKIAEAQQRMFDELLHSVLTRVEQRAKEGDRGDVVNLSGIYQPEAVQYAIEKLKSMGFNAEIRDFKRPMEFGPARTIKYLYISW